MSLSKRTRIRFHDENRESLAAREEWPVSEHGFLSSHLHINTKHFVSQGNSNNYRHYLDSKYGKIVWPDLDREEIGQLVPEAVTDFNSIYRKRKETMGFASRRRERCTHKVCFTECCQKYFK